MHLRLERPFRWHLGHVRPGLVFGTVEANVGAAAAQPRPGTELELLNVLDVEAGMDRDVLPLEPGGVRLPPALERDRTSIGRVHSLAHLFSSTVRSGRNDCLDEDHDLFAELYIGLGVIVLVGYAILR